MNSPTWKQAKEAITLLEALGEEDKAEMFDEELRNTHSDYEVLHLMVKMEKVLA